MRGGREGEGEGRERREGRGGEGRGGEGREGKDGQHTVGGHHVAMTTTATRCLLTPSHTELCLNMVYLVLRVGRGTCGWLACEVRVG